MGSNAARDPSWHRVYMRNYMRLRERAKQAGISVDELRAREGIDELVTQAELQAELAKPARQPRSKAAAGRPPLWCWFGGTWWHELEKNTRPGGNFANSPQDAGSGNRGGPYED